MDLDKMLSEQKKTQPPIVKYMTQEEQLNKAKMFGILENRCKSILLFGPPKLGKTWCYMSAIKEAYERGGKIYLISTDAGTTETFIAYFKDKAPEVSKSVVFYMLSDLNQMYAICKDIRQSVMNNKIANEKSKDIIIIDLISAFYEMAQAKFIDDCSNGDPVNFIIKASHDKSKFGMFEGKIWQYVKKVELYMREQLVVPPICDVFAVATEKDIEIEKKMSKKIVHKYDVTGAKPGGSRELPYDFNTFIYINENNGKRYMQILGHRGLDINPYDRHDYTREFLPDLNKALDKYRK